MEPKTKKKWPILSISVGKDLLAEFDALVATNPLLNRHKVHMMAFRIGLRALQENPERILEEASRG